VSISDDVGHCIYILMHTISHWDARPLKVCIYNRCSGLRLTNRKVFSDRHWSTRGNQEIDSGNMTMTVFRDSLTFEGTFKPDDQSASTSTLLFIAWKYDVYGERRICVQLIECEKQIEWNEIALKVYYQRYANQLSEYTGPIKGT
jgi:hypothetical protein